MLARGWLAYPVTSMHSHLPPSSSDCANGAMRKTAEERIAPSAQYTAIAKKPPKRDCTPCRDASSPRRKTAEERFHTLARGWLAYPVTPMHARLPPKSGCINVIPRFALSRHRATALFRNPVCKAQRSVPGFSSTPTSACRRYATSPPSAVASPIIRHPSVCARGALHLVTPSARSDSRGRMGHRLAPSICASEMRSCADRASGHAFS